MLNGPHLGVAMSRSILESFLKTMHLGRLEPCTLGYAGVPLMSAIHRNIMYAA